ncbi:UDP-glycosyltransferase 83A1 [Cajanus cajan]|uniref:Glycosyltransferase n=1 Tax=Cajanus cajan TaxID=3821 RepID=A0A151TRB4_CAJCA|nr:UDP-glycosyltransferase 83A1 [Cajanus cajan]KYP69602.1 Cytokinin-O-glucosyltransferase 2 [Cajanus cajan]
MARPHVMVVPYPVLGHVIPLMEFSLLLAKQGIKVTFVNTKDNHERIMSAFSSGNDVSSQICLVWISDGLESSEDRKKPGKSSEAILKVLPEKVEELIECINGSESEKITCVLADQSIGWALDIAEKKGIRRAAFCPASAAQLVLGLNIPKLIHNGIIDQDGTPMKKQVIQLAPTMPSVSTEKLVWLCVGNKTIHKHIFQLMLQNTKSIQKAEWLLCNSTYELESATFSMAPEIKPIGPLLSSNHSAGNFWPQDLTCLKWLDQQSPCSVIYVAFGSFTTFSPSQFQELCLGLELSNRPFLCVVQPDITQGSKNAYPEGFLERVVDRGRMVGWTSQQKILSHPSVACFISHCGWNSTVESVCNGIPILCWPYIADQFLNRSYICDVWKVGLGLEPDGSGMITQGEIRSKIQQLLNDEQFKARVKDLKEKVQIGTGQGGLSNNNLDSFISWIKT